MHSDQKQLENIPNQVAFFFNHSFSILVSHQQFKEFVEKGLELISVAPLERSSLKNILQMVPTHLKKHHCTPLEQLLREINDEYLLAVKRASGMSSIKIKVLGIFKLISLEYICIFFLSSNVISVDYTFRYSKLNEEKKANDLPPHRLE